MKTAQRPRPDRHQLSAALADRPTRHLLGCLRDGPATVRDLSVTLAAADLDCARSAVTTADRQQYRTQLEHQHLPRLTDVGLVTRSPGGLVRYVSTALADFDVRLPPLDDPEHDDWPAAAAVLDRPYRYRLVSVVAEQESVSLSRLAERVASTATTQRELAVRLHHVDLPKLAAVDLLTYDPEARTVERTPATEAVL